MTKVNPIPEGYETVTPYLIFKNAAQAIELYKKVFNAEEIFRIEEESGRVGHAEIIIGTSRIMLADEYPEINALSPISYSGTPVSFMMYVADVDAIAEVCSQEGFQTLQPVQDQFYGDRTGTFKDPFGHIWTIGSHIEDVTPEELERRSMAQCK